MIILSPIDFSKCAGNALRYASEMAKMAKAKLLLHHVFTEEDEELDKVRINEIKKSLAVFYKGYGNEYSNVETTIQESPNIKGISTSPLIQKAAFVIMGTKGAGWVKSLFGGSNTVQVMDTITNPVIVVPNKSKPPRKGKPILFITDYHPTENLHVFDPLIYISKLLGAQVVIMHIKKKGTSFETYQLIERIRMEAYLRGKIDYVKETEFNANSETNLENYTVPNNYQLICIMHHQPSLFDHLFRKNQTHEMAFHSNVPLLILNKKSPFNKTYREFRKLYPAIR